MKRRRTLIVSLLLVAALCMGVGYAAVSGNLTISGTAGLDGTEFQVYFEKAQEVSKVGAVEFAVTADTYGSVGKTNIQVTATKFKAVNDSVTFDVYIKNPHDFPVKLTNVTINSPTATNHNGTQIFVVESSELVAEPVIPAGTSVPYEVTITCKATNIDAVSNCAFSITFVANTETT